MPGHVADSSELYKVQMKLAAEQCAVDTKEDVFIANRLGSYVGAGWIYVTRSVPLQASPGEQSRLIGFSCIEIGISFTVRVILKLFANESSTES